jgi:hypothetical protein
MVWIFPFRDMIGGGDDYAAEEKRVETFYAGYLSKREGIIVGLAVAAIGTVFGSIHLLAWSYTFPSSTERILWRVSTLAVTCIPLVLAGLTIIITWIYYSERSDRLDKLDQRNWLESIELLFWWLLLLTWFIFFFLGSFLYVAFRLILLVLPFLSLRSLPPDAYQTVTWTTLIPHLH